MESLSMTTALPAYVEVACDERGQTLNVTFDDYRMLARTALAVTAARETVMGIYSCDGGCALDIWSGNRCLTIQVNSEAGQLGLWLAADIDCGDNPLCILSVGNTDAEWQCLSRMARKAI
jgi:hypothetical protein